MAIEVCTEISSTGISPRISFSHDLKNTDGPVPVEDRHRRSDLCLLDSTSSSDFVFSITTGLAQKLSSADELFSNGKIVPMEFKRVVSISNSNSNAPRKPHQPATTSTRCTEKKRLKEFLSADSDDNAENEDEKPSSKYFWQFKRSSSLNFDPGRGNSLINRSLQFLSRSNSTGSAPNPKETEILQRETQKQRLQKQSSVSSRRSSSSSSSSSTYYFYNSSHKPSLKKNFGSSSGNGVRISPVLNLPQAYIPKAGARFFGFGSLFCNGKIKRKKK